MTQLCNIYYNFCTNQKHVLLIVHKSWHGISPEGYRQVLTKIKQNYICQQGNILLDNLRVLDLVRMSRSHVKGHRRGGVCVLRMLRVVQYSQIWYQNGGNEISDRMMGFNFQNV